MGRYAEVSYRIWYGLVQASNRAVCGLQVAGDKFPLFFDVDGLEEGLEYNFRYGIL